MSEWIVSLFWKWPFISIRRKPAPSYFPPALVYLPDGSLAVISHIKPNEPGMISVKPVTSEGHIFPNRSVHWTEAQRWAVPHEEVVHISSLKPVVFLPGWAK